MSYTLTATTTRGTSVGPGCRIEICEDESTRVAIMHGGLHAGNINLILRETTCDPCTFIGNGYILPDGKWIEYVIVSTKYSFRFEPYLDNYMAVVVTLRESGETGHIPFVPVLITKESKAKAYKPDPALEQRIRDDNVAYAAERLLKKQGFDKDVEKKVKELSIAPKKTTEGCVPAAIDNSTYIEVKTF